MRGRKGSSPPACISHRFGEVVKSLDAVRRTTVAVAVAVEKRSPSLLVAAATLIGTSIEWYDFYVYGYAAALIFPALFFPKSDPFVGQLASYGVFWVGFLGRPLGGIIFGHFGDKVGRKAMLVMTLSIMGIATFLVGLLPTYGQAGMLAPLLLIA